MLLAKTVVSRMKWKVRQAKTVTKWDLVLKALRKFSTNNKIEWPLNSFMANFIPNEVRIVIFILCQMQFHSQIRKLVIAPCSMKVKLYWENIFWVLKYSHSMNFKSNFSLLVEDRKRGWWKLSMNFSFPHFPHSLPTNEMVWIVAAAVCHLASTLCTLEAVPVMSFWH